MALLSWRLWLTLIVAAALAASHYTMYRKGVLHERTINLAAVAEANNEARHLEQARQQATDGAVRLAATAAANDRARLASADRAVSGMRSTLDATERHAKESLDAATATVSAYRAVFESCVSEYRSMAEEAAGHARDSLMYQGAWPH